MMVLGLTGSIGMGKSTVAAMLAEMGVPCHDSDAAARAVIGPGGAAVAAVAQLFPQAFDVKTGAIDRKILGSIVFSDPAKRAALEAAVHPHVRAAQQDFLKAQRALGAKIVALDIPLLYETGAEARVDRVIVVTCPAFLQRRRVLARAGMTEEKFKAILKAQMPDAEKRRRADYVVQTGLGFAFTRAALKRILNELKKSRCHDQDRHRFPPFSP